MVQRDAQVSREAGTTGCKDPASACIRGPRPRSLLSPAPGPDFGQMVLRVRIVPLAGPAGPQRVLVHLQPFRGDARRTPWRPTAHCRPAARRSSSPAGCLYQSANRLAGASCAYNDAAASPAANSRLVSFRHTIRFSGLDLDGRAVRHSPQISSISRSVTAIQPCVQSSSGCRTPFFTPWIMISPPGSTPSRRACVAVVRVGVGNVQRQVISALRIPSVDHVPALPASFRRLPAPCVPAASARVRSGTTAAATSRCSRSISRRPLWTTMRSARRIPQRLMRGV